MPSFEMAHVAEASEGNGRVLFLIDPTRADASAAVEAACQFAAAFNAEIEAVSFNADSVERARALPVTAVVGAHGEEAGAALERAQGQHELSVSRHVGALATAAHRRAVPTFHTAHAGSVVDGLDQLCLARGPWNVIAFGSPASAPDWPLMSEIFANVSGATGLVVAPQRCANAGGPVVIVAEDGERLPAMLRAAGRLKGLCAQVHLVLAAETRRELDALEAHVRLVTAHHKGLRLETVSPMLGLTGALDDVLRSLKASFIIARFAGTLLPAAGALVRTMTSAAAPFLLMR